MLIMGEAIYEIGKLWHPSTAISGRCPIHLEAVMQPVKGLLSRQQPDIHIYDLVPVCE